jgi:hypothetical protein
VNTITEKGLATNRDTVFISKATPEDDEFVLWLAPRLEAAGYKVFADILNLEPGDRWRKEVTNALQNNSIKMLLCCRDATLEKIGVQEEIAIAEDLSKELKDPRFIIPLRLEKFKKLFGIGGLQYVNFVGSWANGLDDLIEALQDQNVARSVEKIEINPNWEAYRMRLAIKVEQAPETLTTNWLRVAEIEGPIRYYQPTGAIDHSVVTGAAKLAPHPAEIYLNGFFTFASPDEVSIDFSAAGKFKVHSEYDIARFLEEGSESLNVKPREAKNLISSIFRKSWDAHCRIRGFLEYAYSSQVGFHVTEEIVKIGKRIPWGKQEARRSSMLCNIAAGKVWQYGVSITPQFWPFPHFRIKSRVLFSELNGLKAGPVFEDKGQQHQFRRKVCKGWRNKQWHGRQMAFLELLAGDSPFIDIALSRSARIILDASPLTVTCPVTTLQIDQMPNDGEELDDSTLGILDVDEEES